MQTSSAVRQRGFSNFSESHEAKHFNKCQALSKVELAFWLLFCYNPLADVYTFRTAIGVKYEEINSINGPAQAKV